MAQLREKLAAERSALPTPRHTHTSTENTRAAKQLECDTKCDGAITLPASVAPTNRARIADDVKGLKTPAGRCVVCEERPHIDAVLVPICRPCASGRARAIANYCAAVLRGHDLIARGANAAPAACLQASNDMIRWRDEVGEPLATWLSRYCAKRDGDPR